MKTRLTLILLCIVSVPGVIAQTPAKSAFFKTSDGISIHYLEAGAGRPIVFIPGWTMPAWIWQKQIDEFSKKYRVIAVEPPLPRRERQTSLRTPARNPRPRL